MYHTIVFDIGGVVVNYNPKEFLVDKFYRERTEKRLYDAVFGSREWEMLDKGEITWRQAEDIFMRRGSEKGLGFEMRAVLDEWPEMLTNRKSTVSLLRLLKKRGFRLLYLSNLSHHAREALREREFWPLFDGGILSCEVGLLKPDLAIYKALIQKYDLFPQETIFTDDLKKNTAAAFEVGITGIQYTDVKSFCQMLFTYGIDL